MKYWGVIIFGSGLGIFFAFLTAILFLGESSPPDIAALIFGLVLVGLGIFITTLDQKIPKKRSSSHTAR